MGSEVISIQNGGGMLTSSIRRAHGVRTKVGARMGSEVISIQNGDGMLTSSIRRAHGVRTKVGRLRKHSVLKSDWFSVILPIL